MTITLINGSPKGKKSTSQFLVNHLEKELTSTKEINQIIFNKDILKSEDLDIINHSDILVFTFPLYYDAIPAHLLPILIELEQKITKKDIHVYGIVNCGFYEGDQNKTALAILQNWCNKTGLSWGQGIGIGGGEGISAVKKPIGKGQLTTLGKQLSILIRNIDSKTSGDTLFSVLDYPKFIYQLGAKYTKWYPSIKKNGLKKKDLKAKRI